MNNYSIWNQRGAKLESRSYSGGISLEAVIEVARKEIKYPIDGEKKVEAKVIKCGDAIVGKVLKDGTWYPWGLNQIT